MIFEQAAIEAFAAVYPDAPATLRHDLCGGPLFEIEQLMRLASLSPPELVEYNAGDLPVSQDPAKTPMNGLSAKETVRRIAEHKSWLVLKNIERDPEYTALLEACCNEIEPAALAATGPMHRREAFIFLSSPGAVTPFHMDPEHNILLQLRGTKSFHIYPNDTGEIVSVEQNEAFHGGNRHRNLPYKEEFDRHAKVIELSPGDALYVPVKSPHWVKVGDEVSISLSITWRSEASDREARLRRGNGWIRARGGNPPLPGASPLRDRAVAFVQRAADRLARR